MFEDLLNRFWGPKAGMFELMASRHQPAGGPHAHSHRGRFCRGRMPGGSRPDLCRYELIQDLPMPASAAPLPDEVCHLLAWQKQDTILPGAYPAHP